jgi:hypothetical protein
MPTLTCPTCGRSLTVSEDLIGKAIKCAACLAVFTAEEPGRSARRGPDPDSRVAAADEDEDRPRRRRRRREYDEDDDFEDRPRRDLVPHRGGMIFGFGLGGLICELVGFFGILCAPFLFFALVGLVLGVVAWVMGTGDLRQMREHVMDPRGESQTRGGRTLGIIAVVLTILGCVSFVGIIGVMLAAGKFK